MKQSWIERFLFWLCDTFGHRKISSGDIEWKHNRSWHYRCTRCNRIVSTPEAQT